MSILVGTAMLASLLVGCQSGGEDAGASVEANAEEMAVQQETQSQIVEAWGEVSAETIKEVHHKQLLTYMRLAKKHIGILVNFNIDRIADSIHRKVL